MSSPSNTSVADVIRRRGAVRRFRSEPINRAILDEAFALAQWAPSNCNTQPWLVRVVSGSASERLKAALVADSAAQRFTVDFPFDPTTFTEPYKTRYAAHGATLHAAHGVSRENAEGRRVMMQNNLAFFGAPHAAFFFMPAWGNERQASDVGMFAQTFALVLTAFGIGCCPQAVLSYFAATVRRELSVSDDYKLLYGMSIGYADTDNPAHRVRNQRSALTDTITYIED